MIAILSLLSRTALSGIVLLLGLAVLRLPPVWAEPPVDVRVLPLLGPAILLAIVAALTGRARPPLPVRPIALGLGGAVAILVAVVCFRPAAGLAAGVSNLEGPIAVLQPGAVDIAGSDLRDLPAGRRWRLTWSGDLRTPASGAYRLWATGRGRLEVILDGRPVLRAEGDRFQSGVDVALLAGPHEIVVDLERSGPGARVRLGWTRPRRDGRAGGLTETVPPRFLGPRRAPLVWLLTDTLAVIAAALGAALVFVLPWDRRGAPPAARPVTRGEVAGSLVGHMALVVLMSWPLASDPAHLGVIDRPDGRLNAWIQAWDSHALLHDPLTLFQAPIFHPLPDALAFSENLLVPAVLSLPFQAGGPVLAYNMALLGSFVLSGLGAQLLVRRVSGGKVAAFVGGAIFAVGAHRWIRLAHLHAQVTLFLPFALLALDRFWERRTVRRALLVGVLLALQGLSSVYLGAITALATVVAVVLAAIGGLTRRDATKLALGFALAAAIMAPAVQPYLRMRAFQGMEWSLEEVSTYATTLSSYAAGGTRLWGPLTQRHIDPDVVRDTTFPGLTVLVLGLMGLTRAPRRYRAVAIVASGAAILFSLGPQTGFYRFLYDHLVFVRGIRALSRFSLVPVLALSVLAALALGRRVWGSLLALLLVLAESSNLPIRYAHYTGPTEVARFLAQGDGAVAVLPLGAGDTAAMLDGVAHFRPLLNGDSGFVPRPYTRAMELLEGDLTEEDLGFLRALGVTQIVTSEKTDLPLAARFGGVGVFAVPPGRTALPVPRGSVRAVPTLVAPNALVADLGQPDLVGCVAFEVSEAPWVPNPVVGFSADGETWTAVPAVASLAEATLSLYRDPRHGLGQACFTPRLTRFVRVDPRLPARPGLLYVRTTP